MWFYLTIMMDMAWDMSHHPLIQQITFDKVYWTKTKRKLEHKTNLWAQCKVINLVLKTQPFSFGASLDVLWITTIEINQPQG